MAAAQISIGDTVTLDPAEAARTIEVASLFRGETITDTPHTVEDVCEASYTATLRPVAGGRAITCSLTPWRRSV